MNGSISKFLDGSRATIENALQNALTDNKALAQQLASAAHVVERMRQEMETKDRRIYELELQVQYANSRTVDDLLDDDDEEQTHRYRRERGEHSSSSSNRASAAVQKMEEFDSVRPDGEIILPSSADQPLPIDGMDLAASVFGIGGAINVTPRSDRYGLLRRFPCDVCAKSFCTKVDLERHLRVHTGERPYKCNGCDMLFKLKSHAVRHYRKKHMGEGEQNDTVLLRNINMYTLNL